MYNNESAGPALEEFLDLLGQRVRLKGFTKYRAQLDNKSKIKHTHPKLNKLQAHALLIQLSADVQLVFYISFGSAVMCSKQIHILIFIFVRLHHQII